MVSKKKEIVVLLDRSGSMQSICKRMEGGFNAFIKEQRALPEDGTVLTLVQFDGPKEYPAETILESMPLQKVPKLSLQPRGNTPLLDALGDTILNTKKRIAKGTPVLFMIITDGMENASSRFSSDRIKEMVKKREKKGWQFMYLGANVDEFAQANLVGVSIDNAAGYGANSVGVAAACAVTSNQVSNFRQGLSVSYTAEERDILNKTKKRTP